MRRYDTPHAAADGDTDLTPAGLLGLVLLLAALPAAGMVAIRPLGATALAGAGLVLLAYRRSSNRTPTDRSAC